MGRMRMDAERLVNISRDNIPSGRPKRMKRHNPWLIKAEPPMIRRRRKRILKFCYTFTCPQLCYLKFLLSLSYGPIVNCRFTVL